MRVLAGARIFDGEKLHDDSALVLEGGVIRALVPSRDRPRGELFPESIFQGDPDFVKDGKVTDKGIRELEAKMPYADLGDFKRNPSLENISNLFTVELITRYIQSKLAS